MRRYPSPYTRFLRGYEVAASGCWHWLRSKDLKGYGQLYVFGAQRRAHRWAYEIFVGPIKDGLEIDHLCRNTSCVNPAHLEAVTPQENQRRRPPKTHCPHGHAYTAENTREYKGRRWCRTCTRATNRRFAMERSRARLEARLAEGRRPDPRMVALREEAA